MITFLSRGIISKLLREGNGLRSCNKLSTQLQVEPGLDKNDEAVVQPLQHPDLFQVRNLFTVRDLFDARVHYGHTLGTLEDHMKPFIFGSRLGHLIIDLEQTAELLRAALNFTAHIAFNGGLILFLSRNPQITLLVERTAQECGEFAYTRVWKKGLFTNPEVQFKAVTRLPDLCMFFNTLDDVLNPHMAVRHSAKMMIPSVGIVDTNCDPRLISYPVPGNDDSLCSIELYCKLFKEAILRGKAARKLVMEHNLDVAS